MPRVSFAAYILLLTVFWMQVFAAANGRAGHDQAAVARAAHLSDRLRAEIRGRALDREALLEFRQNVATLMPGALEKAGRNAPGRSLRELASVVAKPVVPERTRAVIAQTLFERGKALFAAEKYAAANAAFKQIITRYSYTSYAVESYFLLGEGLYQVNELQESIGVINRMVELFPQDEFSGYAMVRLGHILRERDHKDQAIDVFKTVMRTFPNYNVAKLAKDGLREVDL